MKTFTFYLTRLYRNLTTTIGIFSTEGRIICYSLEDEKRAIKLFSKTRIPAEIYEIKFRTEGRLHEKYKRMYPAMHKGMLWIQDIENFTFCYIHQGLNHKHTAGCPLCSTDSHINTKNRYTLVHSAVAYKRLYPLMADPLVNGDRVLLNIRNECNADVYDWQP